MNGVALLAPWGLALGVLAAGALVALHAITVGRPRPAWLPTARFAPDRAPRAERRLARPADRWLLALRVTAALLAAAALAHPVQEPARRHVARVVLADVSDPSTRAAVRDSARTLVGAGDALVAFAATPGAAFVAPPRPATTAADSLALRSAVDSALAIHAERGDAGEGERASLSAALIAARRATPTLATAADSIELVVISPFARGAVDAATLAIRGTWAGRARMVAVVASRADTPSRVPVARPSVSLRGGPTDDALAAAAALAGIAQTDAAPVRVARGTPTPADRAWSADRGHVLVLWPADAGKGRELHPSTPQALVTSTGAAVEAFGRVAIANSVEDPTGRPRTARVPRPPRIIARWADGVPAAIEELSANGGCVRTIGARIPQAGDAALRPDFLALLPSLLGSCAPPRDSAPLAPADRAHLAGGGPLLAAASIRARVSTHLRDILGATLLGIAAALLVLELLLRRRARPSTGSATLADARDAASPTATAGPTAPAPPRTAPDTSTRAAA